MPWKDGFIKRNPGLKWPLYGALLLAGLVVLALTFGPDETREFARDMAEKAGLVDPRPVPEPVPETDPGGVTQ